MRKFRGLYLESVIRFTTLESRMQALELENHELKRESVILKTRITELQQENATLKERLGLNSKNSSIPSSKELYKIKNTNKAKSPRSQGAQVGHAGHTRNKMLADEIVTIDLESLKCECGADIGIIAPRIHQKIDIPEIKPHVTDYHLQRGRCKVCKRRKSSSLPSNITPDLFGPRIKAAIGALTGFYKNSKREVEAILKDLFKVSISLGTVSKNESRVADKCKEAYEDIEAKLSLSKLVHMDETSHYNKSKLGWCWGFFSDNASLIKIEKSRSKKVLEKSVFGAKDQIIVTDRYAAYTYFAEENRQICWAHLARDFERFAHSKHEEVKPIGIYLSKTACEVFALKKALSDKKINVVGFLRRSRKLRKRVWHCLKQISLLGNAQRAVGVAKNMMKSENMMWKFLSDPENIPLTNNHAEQQIRHYVVYRKNSYFTQSERGDRFLERIISLCLTWKKRAQNPVHNLQNLLMLNST